MLTDGGAIIIGQAGKGSGGGGGSIGGSIAAGQVAVGSGANTITGSSTVGATLADASSVGINLNETSVLGLVSVANSGLGGTTLSDTGTGGITIQAAGATFSITSASTEVGGNTTYHGTFPSYSIGPFHDALVSGFIVNPSNNGTFTVVSNTATTLVLANPSGIAETQAASVVIGGFVLLSNTGAQGTSISDTGGGGILIHQSNATIGFTTIQDDGEQAITLNSTNSAAIGILLESASEIELFNTGTSGTVIHDSGGLGVSITNANTISGNISITDDSTTGGAFPTGGGVYLNAAYAIQLSNNGTGAGAGILLSDIGTGGVTISAFVGTGHLALHTNTTGGLTIQHGSGAATPGVNQTAEAVGTLATIDGIVTTFTAVSDERLKLWTPYAGGLAEILNITPIRYRWNEKGQEISGQNGDRDYVGFSAQNASAAIPEVIQSVTKDGYLSFEDRPIIAALVNAVRELNARIEQLERSR